MAKGICDHYQSLGMEERLVFLSLLAGDLGVEHGQVIDQAAELVRLSSQVRPETHSRSVCARLHWLVSSAPRPGLSTCVNKFKNCSRDLFNQLHSLILLLPVLSTQQRAGKPLLMSEGHLRQLLSPFYCVVFTEVAKLEGGVKFLVDLRGDILVGGMLAHCSSHYLCTEQLPTQWWPVNYTV